MDKTTGCEAWRAAARPRVLRAWTTSLLIGEVALATALLVGAGVLVASFVNLLRLDPGLDVHRVVTASITLPDFAFKTRDARAAFARELERQMARLPGVGRVALSSGLPPEAGGFTSDPVQTDVSGAPERRSTVLFSAVEPDFFQVYGIRLLEGRARLMGDARDQAVVSEKLAKTLWPDGSALGHSFTFKGWSESYRVIGVSREVRSTTVFDPLDDLPEFYTPMTLGWTQVGLGMRCESVCPDEATIRERVRATNPQAVVFPVQPLATAYAEQLARPRAASVLAFTFAAVSLVAAATGLFSVLSYTVARRRRKFGIRIAMGARASQIRRLVLVDGIKVAAACHPRRGVGLVVIAGNRGASPSASPPAARWCGRPRSR